MSAFIRLLCLFCVVGAVAGLTPAPRGPATPAARARLGTRARTAPSSAALRVRGGQAAMSLASIAGTVCPTLGVVLCNALYFTPLTAALERSNKGSLGSLNPLPAALTVLANVAWLSYGYAISNPYIVAGNLPGAIAAIAALVTILPLMKGADSLKSTQTVFVGGSALLMSVWSWLVFTGATAATRSSVLGILATVFCILLFSSPLSTIKTVFEQRSSESIYAPATAAQCANCAMWTTYGLFAANDVFVWGPNLTGLLLGLVQLALKIAFPSRK